MYGGYEREQDLNEWLGGATVDNQLPRTGKERAACRRADWACLRREHKRRANRRVEVICYTTRWKIVTVVNVVVRNRMANIPVSKFEPPLRGNNNTVTCSQTRRDSDSTAAEHSK